LYILLCKFALHQTVMKCPVCGYNSFDHLESCKRCGSPLYEEEVSARDDSHNHGQDSGTKSDDDTDEVSPEELLDIPIRNRRDRTHDDTSLSAGEPEDERVDYFERDAEEESFEGLSISKKRERRQPARPKRGEEKRRADSQMDLFEKGGESSYREERSYGLTEGRQDVRKPMRESGYESYDNETLVFNLAGFFSRTAAFLIDLFIVAMTAFLAIITGFKILSGPNGVIESLNDLFIPVYLALLFLASSYFIFFHGLAGKTVGKMMFGIRVINGEGESIGLWDAFLRWIGYFISASFLFIGFLWALFDSEGQTWHDKIAGSYVVRD
jgi:uncharacterized RDD family membrane protein YckC